MNRLTFAALAGIFVALALYLILELRRERRSGSTSWKGVTIDLADRPEAYWLMVGTKMAFVVVVILSSIAFTWLAIFGSPYGD